MSRPKILLDPVDFDALHLSALMFGGIGRGYTGFWEHPHCVVGHAGAMDRDSGVVGSPYDTPFAERLGRAGLGFRDNDKALRGERGTVSFDRYCELLNLDVRG